TSAKARAEAAVSQYTQTIQQAFREVADALVEQRKRREFRLQQEALTRAAEDTSRLANMRYTGGYSSYLEVLDSERQFFDAELGRLPRGGGRPGGHLGQPSAALLRAGAVERARPLPEGAPLRADRAPGQPRRGREGVLLLPRLDAHPLLHEVPLQVPARGLPVRTPRRGERGPEPERARVRADRHRDLRREPLLRRHRRVREGRNRRHPGAHHRGQSRPRGRR